MKVSIARPSWVTCFALLLATTGCRSVPGRPGPEPLVPRPEQVTDFKTLYSENCAACHGVNGRDGAAISLANPVYLAYAGAGTIARVTGAGLPGTMMPPFSKAGGGMLTDQQIEILAQGMVSAWGDPAALGGVAPPEYAGAAQGDAANGQKSYTVFCARCHGADGSGMHQGEMRTGSLIDPAYLALISNQGLRSFIVAGQTGMPDWRSDAPGRAMRSQEIDDVVAWLAGHRTANPGQPYQEHP